MLEEPIQFQPTEDQETAVSSKRKKIFIFLVSSLTALVILGIIVITYIQELNKSPVNFPSNTPITIETGTDVKEITEILQQKNVIKSDKLLYYILVLMHEPTDLKASTYVFDEPISTYDIATRLTEGDFDTNLVRFTHFEGERARQIAKRASEVLVNFDEQSFIQAVEENELEGKLFPETYFVPSEFTDTELLQLLTETFYSEISSLEETITNHSLSTEEVLVLASIIEREANTEESMSLVSSVLQNRLEIGMALQADASIEYILDKPLSELTPEDLKIDSPYNTYLYPGLPPTPIGNPGLSAITAVLEPTESDYFYYITDDDGEFHFAKTYREHLVNIEKYLR